MESHIRYVINRLDSRTGIWSNPTKKYEDEARKRRNVVLREILDDELENSVNTTSIDSSVDSGCVNEKDTISEVDSANIDDGQDSGEDWETENDSYVSYDDDYEESDRVPRNDPSIDGFGRNSLFTIFEPETNLKSVFRYRLKVCLMVAFTLIACCFRFFWRCLRYMLPSATPTNLAVLTVVASTAAPSVIFNYAIYPFSRLLFGTLYPAYASYKAVRTKNVKEYVKWMMYWIVFALFTCAETFTDVFFNWFPFYYEVKILMVIWLLSPATKGSSILYRKFVHPALCRREQEIDEYISKAKDQGYHTVLNLGTKGVNYATNVIMQTAIKGGGGLVQQLRKSYSLSDLSMSDDRSERSQQELDEVDDVVSLSDSRVVRRSLQGRTPREVRGPRTMSAPRMDMIFAEVDVDRHSGRLPNSRDSVNLSHIRSSEDISGPYPPEKSNSHDILTRTASVGGASTRTRSKVIRSTYTSIKRPGAAEDEDVLIQELEDDYSLPGSVMQNIPSSLFPDGTVCVPNSNDMLVQYLRYLMEKDLVEKNSEKNEKTGDDYENYLKLKEKFDKTKESENVIGIDKVGGVAKDSSKEVDAIKILTIETIVSVDKKQDVNESQNVNSPSELPTDSTVEEKGNLKLTTATDVECVKKPILDVVDKGDDEQENVSRKLSDISNSSIQLDQVLKLGDSLVPDLAIIRSSKSTEEIASIGASSSTVSSDDEMSEFATPSSSPKLKPKVKKTGKLKKRLAPPPPPPTNKPNDNSNNNLEDKPNEKFKDELISKLDVIEDIQKQNLKDDHTKIVESKEIINDENASQSSKSGFKGVSSLSKLMHLPAKLPFWGSSDNTKKGHTPKGKQSTGDENAKIAIDSVPIIQSSDLVVKNEDVLNKANLESDEEYFQDAANEIEQSTSIEIKKDTENDNVKDGNSETDKVEDIKKVPEVENVTDNSNNDYVYIPLTIAALNTESKSTDV